RDFALLTSNLKSQNSKATHTVSVQGLPTRVNQKFEDQQESRAFRHIVLSGSHHCKVNHLGCSNPGIHASNLIPRLEAQPTLSIRQRRQQAEAKHKRDAGNVSIMTNARIQPALVAIYVSPVIKGILG